MWVLIAPLVAEVRKLLQAELGANKQAEAFGWRKSRFWLSRPMSQTTWTLKLPIRMGYHPIILGVKPIVKGILRVQVYSSRFLTFGIEFVAIQKGRLSETVGHECKQNASQA